MAMLQDLAVLVDRRWSEGIAPMERPPPEVIAEVAETVFFASMQHDEGRLSRVHVAYTKRPLVPMSTGAVFGYNVSSVQFEKSMPLTVGALAKLAPAVDPRTTAIGIEGEAGALSIWGLVHLGSSIEAMVFGEAFKAEGHSFLTVRSDSIGEVRIFGGGYLLGHFAQGRIQDLGAPLLDEPGPVLAEFLKRAPFDPATRSQTEANAIYTYRRFTAKQTVRRLLGRIESLGHGGTLLLVDPAQASAFIENRRDLGSNGTLQCALKVAAKEEHALLDSLAQKGLVSPPDDFAHVIASERPYFDAVDFVTQLAAADGAVVLDFELRLLGFSARILPSKAPEVFQARDAKGEQRRPFDLTRVGTRHTSAATICEFAPSTLAFAISQDGPISCFKRVDGRVIVWRPVAIEHHPTVRRFEPTARP